MPSAGVLLTLEMRGIPIFPSAIIRRSRMNTSLCVFEQNERHSYEKCQYEEFKKRVAKMDEMRDAKGGARSN